MALVKAKRISCACCGMVVGQIYEGVLGDGGIYFNPLVFGEYQGDHIVDGFFEILKPTPPSGDRGDSDE